MPGISPVNSSNSYLAASPFHENFNTQNVDNKNSKPITNTQGGFTPLQKEVIKVSEKLWTAARKVHEAKGKNLAEFFDLRRQISDAERSPYAKYPGVQQEIKEAKAVEAYYRPQARAAAQKLVDQLR